MIGTIEMDDWLGQLEWMIDVEGVETNRPGREEWPG